MSVCVLRRCGDGTYADGDDGHGRRSFEVVLSVPRCLLGSHGIHVMGFFFLCFLTALSVELQRLGITLVSVLVCASHPAYIADRIVQATEDRFTSPRCYTRKSVCSRNDLQRYLAATRNYFFPWRLGVQSM